MKRLLCFILIFIIIFNSVVYADSLLIPDDEHTFYGVNTNRYYSTKDEAVQAELDYLVANGEPNFWIFLSTSLGIIDSGDVIGTLKEIFSSNIDDFVKEIDITDEGQLKFTATTLVKIRNLIEQEMKDKEPYKIYYPSEYPTPYYEGSETKYILPSDSTAYVKARNYFDTFFGIGYSNYRFSLIDSKKFKYAYLSNGYIRLTDKDLNSVNAVLTLYTKRGNSFSAFYGNPLDEYSYDSIVEFLGEENVSWSDGYEKLYVGVNSDGTPVYRCYHLGVTRDFCGQPMQVFNSLEDLYNYVNSKPTAYYTTDYYNKTYNDITLNQETIKNYTTENIQNIYNTINNNTQDALTQEELQEIIDSTVTSELEKITGSLDDVNDELDEISSYLKTITETLNKCLDEFEAGNSWLEKIYNVLLDMDETLLIISSDLEDILEDDGLLDQTVNATTMSQVLNIFLYGVSEPEEETQTVYSSLDSTELIISRSVYASRSSGGVVGLIFDKFPFCVPWDIYYCFLSLAETPEAPHFDFVFDIPSLNFTYTYTFDLEKFSLLSELSRMFLTLTFVVYMTHLTKKVVGGK